MKTQESVCRVTTSGAPDIVDITDELQEVVDHSGISDGHVTVSSEGDACSLVVNERESGLLADIKRTIERLGTDPDLTLGAGSLVLPATEGRLRLGTWQRVMLIELEGPQERTVTVTIEGE